MNYRRIAGQDCDWLQNVLTVTVAMFRQMELDTKFYKTKVMVCTPRFIWGKWGWLVYKRHLMVEGTTFR